MEQLNESRKAILTEILDID